MQLVGKTLSQFIGALVMRFLKLLSMYVFIHFAVLLISFGQLYIVAYKLYLHVCICFT
jgi:hypothetical protein